MKSTVADQLKYRMVKSYLVDELGETATVELIDKPFDFEDYQNTPLDGPEIEGTIQEHLLELSELINKTLLNTTTEYRRQARMEIGRLIKDNVDTWINQDIELSA